MEITQSLISKEDCIICFDDTSTDKLYDLQMENCGCCCKIHKSCIYKWNSTNKKQKCPICSTNGKTYIVENVVVEVKGDYEQVNINIPRPNRCRDNLVKTIIVSFTFIIIISGLYVYGLTT